MARAINIQLIIEEIQSSLEIPSYSEHDKGFDDGLKYVLGLIEEAPTLTPPNEPRAGLYGKYTVYKNKDGSLVTDCFILRPAKDPAAVAALRAYAAATDNAELAADIINWVGAEPNEWVSVEERLPEVGQEVLVYWRNTSQKAEHFELTHYDGDHWFLLDNTERPWIVVVAWTPLPAPPDRRPP